MRMKLLIAIVDAEVTEVAMEAARQAGAQGATLIHRARGEGLRGFREVLGLDLSACRDVLLFIVSIDIAATVAERIATAADFDETEGTGIVFQLNVEDSVGLRHQLWRIGSDEPQEDPA